MNCECICSRVTMWFCTVRFPFPVGFQTSGPKTGSMRVWPWSTRIYRTHRPCSTSVTLSATRDPSSSSPRFVNFLKRTKFCCNIQSSCDPQAGWIRDYGQLQTNNVLVVKLDQYVTTQIPITQWAFYRFWMYCAVVCKSVPLGRFLDSKNKSLTLDKSSKWFCFPLWRCMWLLIWGWISFYCCSQI